MKKILIISVLWVILLVAKSAADDYPFNSPSNYGISGLMDIPNARVIKYGKYRVGASYVFPYAKFYITFSPWKNLELNGLITDIRHVKGFNNNTSYGDYKDKDVDFKYQIVKEGKWLPAIAIGGNDLVGTRLYASQYIVASKQIWPFDFTIGIGNGRYGKKQLGRSRSKFEFEMLHHPVQWLKDSKVFGGIEFAPSDKYSIMLEYDSTEFSKQKKDPALRKYFHKPVKSHWNIGARIKPTRWAELDISYQRGKRLGVNLSMNFSIGKPTIPIYYPSYVEPIEFINYPFLKRLALGLFKMGFSNIQVDKKDKDVFIAVQNDRYFYPSKAIGAVIEVLERVDIPKDNKVHIIIENNFIPMFEFSIKSNDILDLKNHKLTKDQFLYLSKLKTSDIEVPRMKVYNRTYFSYGIKPSVETFLNDPSGFFKYRAGIFVWGKYFPWEGASVYSAVGTYFINNISTVNKPLSIPVRSDFAKYEKKNISLDSLLFNQIFKVKNTYIKATAGLLEYEYAGFDWEIAKPLLKGKIFIGAGGSFVKKRDPDNPLNLEHNEKGLKTLYTPIFAKTRLNLFKDGLYVDLKAGKFLAGDKGVRIQITKDIRGVKLSFWYSITNTSVFHDNINRGYHDYGVALTLPMRLFKGRDTKVEYYYSISPWTRDVAQDIGHYNELFDYMERYQELYLYAHGGEIFKRVDY